MSTIRSMLPAAAAPYTEAIVGAALGAIVSAFVVKRKMTTGALVGAIAGYGIALTRKGGAVPFVAGDGYYAGAEEVVEELPGGQVEELVMPDWQRDWRRHGWHGWKNDRGRWGHGYRR
jgi:hypothetical protein